MIGILGVLMIGCGSPDEPPPTGPSNVVVLLVDTLRADHMSAYGYERQTTPRLDSTLNQFTVFDRARSQASCTFPSVNSLLTSRHAAVFYRQFYGGGQEDMGIPPDVPSLAELLKARGYITVAVSASPIVRATPSENNPTAGFGRGFDVFDESPLGREAAFVNQRALSHLRGIRQPFFLYLHYMDPHDPYLPPESYRRQFASEYGGPDFIRLGDPNPIADMLYADGPQVEFSHDDIQHLVDLYDDEIAYADGQIVELLGDLRKRGLLDRSIVVVTADHGEEFMEHGHMKHCRVLFDSSTRVPLMLRIPGVEGGKRIDTAVQNLDIVPTILDYLGLQVPDNRFEGSSLRALIEGTPEPPRFAFSNEGKWRSADDGRYKLIMDGTNLHEELFDLRADPLEEHDLWRVQPPRAAVLDVRIREWLMRTEGGIGTREALEAARRKEQQLRALGYLQ